MAVGDCGDLKQKLLFSLFITYVVALFLIALRDDRFLRDLIKFRMLPFSIKRFGDAAILNIALVVAFFAIVALPLQCG